MEVLFASDASIQGPAAAPHAHVGEVCVNIHAQFEFLNQSNVVHVILFMVGSNFRHLSELPVVQDKGKGIVPDYTQTCPGPSQDSLVDEVSYLFMLESFAHLCLDYIVYNISNCNP